jgi:hypothetical protein
VVCKLVLLARKINNTKYKITALFTRKINVTVLMDFTQKDVTSQDSSTFGLNILLSIPFSNTGSLRSSLKVRDIR